MKTRNPALRQGLVVLACSAMAACTNTPQQTPVNYQSRPSPTAQDANSAPDSARPRLVIQAGEGERLNLPWFIRDTQEWVNRY